MARMSKKKARAAIDATLGNMTKAAEACGVSRGYFYQYCKDKHPDLWDYVLEARDKLVDNLENKSYEVAMRGNPSMLQFLLKNQGRDRGYADRLEQNTTGDQTIRVIYDRSEPVDPPPDAK